MTEMITPGVGAMNLAFASDDIAYISWKYGAEEAVPNLRHTKEVIGVYLTAGARIHLHRYLDRLEENAMYCDTDSVIYFQPKGDGTTKLIQTGNKFRNSRVVGQRTTRTEWSIL